MLHSIPGLGVGSARRNLCGLAIFLLGLLAGVARGDDRLIGTWSMDEGFQVVELTFRSDGLYVKEKHTSDPNLDRALTERGRYEVVGDQLIFRSFEYFGEPEAKAFWLSVQGTELVLTRVEFEYTETYVLRDGSRAEVLTREQVPHDPVGIWRRPFAFSGTEQYTFRPGGYFEVKREFPDSPFPPEMIRGRYEVDGARLALRPYSGVEAVYALDFFGATLTLIRAEALSGDWTAFEELPGSRAVVRAKSSEAESFLARPGWQVGEWEIRGYLVSIDVTIRPDGHYAAVNHSEILRGTVRGRYQLAGRQLSLLPFVGQGIYSRSNGDFGKVDQTKTLDYYDGELLLIDPTALSQSVLVARKKDGSETTVSEKTRAAQATRTADGWLTGIWEVRDPVGWMRFTFRPDQRYIVSAGTGDGASEVERGRFVLGADKLTLAPYSGLGPARGFEMDYYDGDLFLAGDLGRLVIARKVAGSETEVIARTRDPVAMKGERGGILGLWTANLPGQSSRLVFRDDGEFRLERCSGKTMTLDYGLYDVDMAARTATVDSRFTPRQVLALDFYGETVTLHGGLGAPSTYAVNLGTVDSAIEASHLADAQREAVDDQWLARVRVAPRDPNVVQHPTGTLPADPRPDQRFPEAVVLDPYRLYRRLIPGFVYFNVQGVIRSVAVVHTREWHFFPTGRVLVRFRNYVAAPIYPHTFEEVSDNWGAYRVEPVDDRRDILHRYADDVVRVVSDLGESVELTLEDGRRHLFWEKDFMRLSEWAAEEKPIPCEPANGVEPELANTGVSLATTIAPDALPDPSPVLLGIEAEPANTFVIHGRAPVPGRVVIDRTTRMDAAMDWRPVLTNAVPAGPFQLSVRGGNDATGYFRVRRAD